MFASGNHHAGRGRASRRTIKTRTGWLSLLALLALCCAVGLGLAACDGTGVGGPGCDDGDGDGYGEGESCSGQDCNDMDPGCWASGDACCDPAGGLCVEMRGGEVLSEELHPGFGLPRVRRVPLPEQPVHAGWRHLLPAEHHAVGRLGWHR
jgi:hypothetical protein